MDNICHATLKAKLIYLKMIYVKFTACCLEDQKPKRDAPLRG